MCLPQQSGTGQLSGLFGVRMTLEFRILIFFVFFLNILANHSVSVCILWRCSQSSLFSAWMKDS